MEKEITGNLEKDLTRVKEQISLIHNEHNFPSKVMGTIKEYDWWINAILNIKMVAYHNGLAEGEIKAKEETTVNSSCANK